MTYEEFCEIVRAGIASGGDRRSDSFKNDSGVHFETKTEVIEKAGFTPKQVQRFESIAARPYKAGYFLIERMHIILSRRRERPQK